METKGDVGPNQNPNSKTHSTRFVGFHSSSPSKSYLRPTENTWQRQKINPAFQNPDKSIHFFNVGFEMLNRGIHVVSCSSEKQWV